MRILTLNILYYFFAKWEDGGKGEFEMLHSPRDTNDSATENQTEDKMRERNFPPSQHNPKHIEYNL